MTPFRAGFINEIIKMQRKSKLVTGAIISLVAAILWQSVLNLIAGGIGVRIEAPTSFSLSVLSFYTATLLPLFAVFVVIDSFNGEHAANTMKQTLTKPLTRFGVYSSKVLAVFTFLLFSLLFMMLLTVIISLLNLGGSFSIAAFMDIAIAYTVTWLPLAVFLLLVILLAQFTRNGILTFFLSIFSYLVLHGLRIFNPNLANLLIVPLFDWYVGWIADISNFGVLLRQSSILIGTGLLLFGVGCSIFERKDM